MKLTSLGPALALATLVAIAPSAQTPAPQSAPPAARPKLIVLIVVLRNPALTRLV